MQKLCTRARTAGRAEVLARDQLLVDKEKAYQALKTVLARQPGPEITEQARAALRGGFESVLDYFREFAW